MTNISIHPVKYWSESKKAEVRIEDMATAHILNALRKLGDSTETAVLRSSMACELIRRGCLWSEESQRWTVPQKSEEATS